MNPLKAIACISLLPVCILGGLLIGLILAIVYTVSLANQLWRVMRG